MMGRVYSFILGEFHSSRSFCRTRTDLTEEVLASDGAFFGVNTESDLRRLLSLESGGRPISPPAR